MKTFSDVKIGQTFFRESCGQKMIRIAKTESVNAISLEGSHSGCRYLVSDDELVRATRVANEAVVLFAYSKGEGNVRAKTLCKAAVDLGFDVSIHRENGGFATNGNGQPGRIGPKNWPAD